MRSIKAFCVFVYDGDTIAVDPRQAGFKWVRLASIDAPEINQKLGRESKNNLASLCAKREVTINVVATDRFGRTVAQVLVDGIDASVFQARLGMAFPFYLNRINQGEIMIATAQARESRLGVWGLDTITLPEAFRKKVEEERRKDGIVTNIKITSYSAMNRWV
ncbi:MAG: thermonuclease family protein [Pseudanabaenaceae cyanobacterium]